MGVVGLKLRCSARISEKSTPFYVKDYDLVAAILELGKNNLNERLYIRVQLELSYTDKSFFKNILSYVYPNSIEIKDYTNIFPIVVFTNMSQLDRRKVNFDRNSIMTYEEFTSAMSSRTAIQFWSNFKRIKSIVNMRTLVENNSIEFRCFNMTNNKEKLMGIINFCEDFVSEALKSSARKSVCELLELNNYNIE